MRNDAVGILLMAGRGERFAASMPKQFFPYDGEPLFLSGAKLLAAALPSVVYVTLDGCQEETQKALQNAGIWRDSDRIVVGGSTRQESVKEGLKALPIDLDPATVVVLHDGSRPDTAEEDLDAVIEAANVYGAAVLALASTDSIAVSQQGELAENYLDRKTIYRVQTPQAFRLHLLEEAEIAAEQEKQPFTDEGSMVLKTLGVRPKIVLGHRKNEKITTAMDLGERL